MTLDNIIDYVKDVKSIAPLYKDILKPTDKAVTFRTDNNNPNTTVYMDGTSEGEFDLKIICASEDMDECVSQLNSYSEKLNLVEYTEIVTDRLFVKSYTVNGPEFKGIRDNNTKVYESLIKINYIERKG